ncbi:MAG: hypothetical protein ACK5XN_09500 [Bacteroidota bacterium]
MSQEEASKTALQEQDSCGAGSPGGAGFEKGNTCAKASVASAGAIVVKKKARGAASEAEWTIDLTRVKRLQGIDSEAALKLVEEAGAKTGLDGVLSDDEKLKRSQVVSQLLAESWRMDRWGDADRPPNHFHSMWQQASGELARVRADILSSVDKHEREASDIAKQLDEVNEFIGSIYARASDDYNVNDSLSDEDKQLLSVKVLERRQLLSQWEEKHIDISKAWSKRVYEDIIRFAESEGVAKDAQERAKYLRGKAVKASPKGESLDSMQQLPWPSLLQREKNAAIMPDTIPIEFDVIKKRFDQYKDQRSEAQKIIAASVNPLLYPKILDVPLLHAGTRSANVAKPVYSEDSAEPSYQSSYIAIRPGDAVGSYVHEYGHEIENLSDEVRRLCRSFVEGRTARTENARMAEVFPHNGYDESEVGNKDHFGEAISATALPKDRESLEYYVGKKYKTGHTEVLSVGLELMMANPRAFAAEDPDWFDLVTGVLTGRLVDGAREKMRANADALRRKASS